MPKSYSNTYLYNKFPYEEKLFKFIMSADQISTVDDSLKISSSNSKRDR